MRTTFKPSKIVAVLLAVIIASAACVATSLFIDGTKDADLIVISYGCFFLGLVAMFSRIAFEGLSTRIGMGGIEQVCLMRRGKLVTRKSVMWAQVTNFTQKGHVVHLTSNDFTVRLDLAFYGDMAEVINFIQSRCPAGSDESSRSPT